MIKQATGRDLQAELPTLCFEKVKKLREVLNVRVTAGHRPAQAQEEPAEWGRFLSFCLRSQKVCKMKSKFLSFRVLAGGFVIGYAKKSWFSANIKK